MQRFVRTFLAAVAAVLICGATTTSPARAADSAPTAQKKKVYFLVGGASHGFGAHDHLSGCSLLAKRISAVPGFEGVVVKEGWPKDASILNDAAAVVMYCDGGPGHLGLAHVKELDKLSNKGVGIGCIHYGVEVPKDNGGEWWLKWMGGYFEPFYSVNPHWQGKFTEIPKHAVTNGIKPFSTHDEWYYNMRFRDNMEGVTPILTAIPPDDTRKGGDDAHGGNPTVRGAIGKNQKEHVLWVSENASGSRGFGTTGGHDHWNWAQDDFRNVVLNSIVWIAKGEVPADGVKSERPDVDEMLSNHDEKVPDEYKTDAKKAELKKRFDDLNKPLEADKK